MMMEHDSGPMQPNELAPETVAAIRSALERYVRHPVEPAPEVRAALHDLAREARVQSMPPEQLLLVLKDIWQSLPDVICAQDHGEQTRILQRVVTMCIKEYFAD